MVLLSSCTRHAGWDGVLQAGGSSTAGTGGAPEIGVEQSCCVDGPRDPFEGIGYVAISTPDDPNDAAQTCEQLGLEPGFVAHGDPIVPQSTCPTCECAAASCKLSEEMAASSAKCPGGAISTPFDASPGWSGSCDDSSPIPADLQCNGAPCVESVSISATTIEPCQAKQNGTPDIPTPSWGTTARECHLRDTSSGGCGTDDVCVPFVPPGYAVCLWAHGVHDCTDPEYPRRFVVYDTVQDDRACSPCQCGDPQGAECIALVSLFSDGACTSLAGAVKVAPDQPACVDVLTGSALLSKGAFFISDTPGVCASSGGDLTGSVALTDPRTLCCQPAPRVPG